MKRLIAIIACLLMVAFAAQAEEIDLASMSYDDLIALQQKVTETIMSRPEWKQVEVPAGTYTIGIDIPAGWYSVTPKDAWTSVTMRYYPKPDNDAWDYFRITDRLGRFEFYEGMRIMLEGSVYFAPPASLGF